MNSWARHSPGHWGCRLPPPAPLSTGLGSTWSSAPAHPRLPPVLLGLTRSRSTKCCRAPEQPLLDSPHPLQPHCAPLAQPSTAGASAAGPGPPEPLGTWILAPGIAIASSSSSSQHEEPPPPHDGSVIGESRSHCGAVEPAAAGAPWPLRPTSPGSAPPPSTTWAPPDGAASAARVLPQDSPRAGAAPQDQG